MTRSLLSAVAIAAVLLLAACSPAGAKTWQITVKPREQDAYEKVHYRLWLPEEIGRVRGVIFRQHGCGGGARKFGLEHANDIQWRALARKWDCALIGSQMWAPEEDCSTWTMPEDGSAHAYLSALSRLAKLSDHAEIEYVPWCLWGHSGGAVWVTNMTYRYPNRIIAAFPRSGGLSPVGRKFTRSQPAKFDSSPAALTTPILFCYGDQEHVEGTRFYNGVHGAYLLFEYGRRNEANWSVAVHPNSGHENSNSRLLAIRFFDALLKQRLPKANNPKSPVAPKPVLQTEAWLGDLKTLEIFPAASFAAAKEKMIWLPSQATAKAWREWSQTGEITDKTPPPAPFHVSLIEKDNSVTIGFQAWADIESGIRRFIVYRNGEKIGEIGGPVVKRWNPRGDYHAWNYSDQPLQGVEPPPLEFEDKSGQHSIKAKYTITAVNKAGLESPPSKPAKGGSY